MPSGILNADIGFPAFTGTESTEDKIGQISNYLYMLLEQLKYSFANLGPENFNSGGMTEITEVINRPVNIQIGNLESGFGQITKAVDSLNIRVGSAEGSITSIQAFNEGLTISVTNGTDYSVISLKSGDVKIASQTIQFLGQVVFASQLSDGITVISGSNIKTGTIEGIDIRSGVFKTLLTPGGASSGEIQFWYRSYNTEYVDGIPVGELVGGIKYDASGSGSGVEARRRLIIYTNAGVLKLLSAANLSIECAYGSDIYIGGDGQTVNLNGTVKINGKEQ